MRHRSKLKLIYPVIFKANTNITIVTARKHSYITVSQKIQGYKPKKKKKDK